MIGIIGAMDNEVSSLLKNLKDKEIISQGIYTFYKGVLCNQDVVILKSGIGKVSSAVGAALMINLFKPTLIINSGIAGGVTPLHTKDVILAETLSYGDVDVTVFGYELGQVPNMPYEYKTDPTILKKIKDVLTNNNIDYKIGNVVTTDSFITSLKKVNSKKKNNMICEMEGASIAQTCHILNTKFISVRFVSDIIDSDEQVNNYKEFEDEMALLSSQILMDILNEIQIV